MSVFGTARWDHDIWGGKRDRPGAGWGTTWRIWYQVGAGVVVDLTEMCVEMRWTTDSHTTGDGTFRGDLQPGKAAVRFWDPGHTLETLDKTGAVWAAYTPTGATWCWFYDSVQRGLVAPGDPQGADVVFNGATWPLRLTSPMDYLTFPVQSINARLSALVAAMQAHTELALPALTLTQDNAGQLVTAPAVDATWQPGSGGANRYPSYLDQIRAASANGVTWWQYGRDATGAGTLTLRYTDWDTVLPYRHLDPAQVIAGPPVTQSIEWVMNMGRFTATKGDTGAQTTVVYADPTGHKYGQCVLDMRMWGDVSGSGPEHGGASNVLATLTTAHADPAAQTLSNINLQSGPRWTPDGRPSAHVWDPTAHVYAPNEVAQYLRPGASAYDYYRVAKSDHTLNAFNWSSTHTLDMYVAGTPLP